MHFSCICTFIYLYSYTELFGALLFVSVSLFLSVCIMAPKLKSTPSQNPLCSKASSSDPTPSHIQFHDEKACKDFSENFSRRSKHQIVLSNFSDTDLPTVIHSKGWELLCGGSVTCPSVITQSFTPICTVLIIQYLIFLLVFEVHALWSLQMLYLRCYMSRGWHILTTPVVSVLRLCLKTSLCLYSMRLLPLGVIVRIPVALSLLKV